MSPAPLRVHQRISGMAFSQINNYLANKSCQAYAAPFDVRLLNKRKKMVNAKFITSVVQPDISVICDLDKLDDKGCIGSPDWIIEILSPGNTKKEMKENFSLYEENGVKEYWIIYPAYFQVSVFDLKDEKFVWRDTYVQDEMIPVGIFDGFSIDSDNMFS